MDFRALENLQIGTYGWQRNLLAAQFYPDDLPLDWLLDYYSNAFRVVLAPQSVWLAWDEEELQEVGAAVESPFCFYFAIEGALTDEKISQLVKVVGLLKAVACGVVVWSEQPFEQVEIAGLPVTLISTQYKLPGWSWKNQGLWMSGEPLAYLPELTSDAKGQVALLKGFMQSLEDTGLNKEQLAAPCIVGGEEIDMLQVTNLKVIGEFLGY